MAELNGMQGNEIADDFKRKAVSQGRWRDTWDVFKGSFWKLIVLNLIVLVTFVPGIVIIYFRSAYIQSLGGLYPFNATVGNYSPEVLTGLAERVNLSADILFYGLLIVAGLFASLGISGATYCIRKLLQTHGQFQFKSFFHGIKVGYLSTAFPVTVFMFLMYGTFIVGDWMHIARAINQNVAGSVTAYVFMIIADVLAGIYLAWIFAIGNSYRVKVGYMFRNAFILIIGTPIQTVFMAGFSLIPVWFMMGGGFWRIIGIIFMVFIGFSFILISWLSFTQWAFDMFIAPAVKAEKEAANAQKSEKELAEEKAAADRQRALELLAAGKSELIARPIKPIDRSEKILPLGKTFTRAGIAMAEQNRSRISEEIASYEREHQNDPVYVEYNKMFAEREKALQEDPKDKKKKRISAENLLK